MKTNFFTPSDPGFEDRAIFALASISAAYMEESAIVSYIEKITGKTVELLKSDPTSGYCRCIIVRSPELEFTVTAGRGTVFDLQPSVLPRFISAAISSSPGATVEIANMLSAAGKTNAADDLRLFFGSNYNTWEVVRHTEKFITDATRDGLLSPTDKHAMAGHSLYASVSIIFAARREGCEAFCLDSPGHAPANIALIRKELFSDESKWHVVQGHPNIINTYGGIKEGNIWQVELPSEVKRDILVNKLGFTETASGEIYSLYEGMAFSLEDAFSAFSHHPQVVFALHSVEFNVEVITNGQASITQVRNLKPRPVGLSTTDIHESIVDGYSKALDLPTLLPKFSAPITPATTESNSPSSHINHDYSPLHPTTIHTSFAPNSHVDNATPTCMEPPPSLLLTSDAVDKLQQASLEDIEETAKKSTMFQDPRDIYRDIQAPLISTPGLSIGLSVNSTGFPDGVRVSGSIGSMDVDGKIYPGVILGLFQLAGKAIAKSKLTPEQKAISSFLRRIETGFNTKEEMCQFSTDLDKEKVLNTLDKNMLWKTAVNNSEYVPDIRAAYLYRYSDKLKSHLASRKLELDREATVPVDGVLYDPIFGYMTEANKALYKALDLAIRTGNAQEMIRSLLASQPVTSPVKQALIDGIDVKKNVTEIFRQREWSFKIKPQLDAMTFHQGRLKKPRKISTAHKEIKVFVEKHARTHPEILPEYIKHLLQQEQVEEAIAFLQKRDDADSQRILYQIHAKYKKSENTIQNGQKNSTDFHEKTDKESLKKEYYSKIDKLSEEGNFSEADKVRMEGIQENIFTENDNEKILSKFLYDYLRLENPNQESSNIIRNIIKKLDGCHINDFTLIINMMSYYCNSQRDFEKAKKHYLEHVKELHGELNIDQQLQAQQMLENYIFLAINNTKANELPDLGDLEENLTQDLKLSVVHNLCKKVKRTFIVANSGKVIDDTAAFFVSICVYIKNDFERNTLLGIVCTEKILTTIFSTGANFDKKILIESERICRQLQNNNLSEEQRGHLNAKLFRIKTIFYDACFWHAAASVIDTGRLFLASQKKKKNNDEELNYYFDDSVPETTLHGLSLTAEGVGTVLDILATPEWSAWGIAQIAFQLTKLGLGTTEFIDKLSGHFCGHNAALGLRENFFAKEYLYESVRLGGGMFSVVYDWSADALLLNTGFQLAAMMAPYIKLSQYDLDDTSDLNAIIEPQEGKIYVAIKNNKIQYKVKNTDGTVISSNISARELGKKIPTDTKELHSLLHNILTVTSRRGHTESYINSLIREQTGLNIEASLYPTNEALIQKGELQPVNESLTLVACIDGVKESVGMVGIAPVAKVMTTAATSTAAAIMSLLPATAPVVVTAAAGAGLAVGEALIAEAILGTVATEVAVGTVAAEVATGAVVAAEATGLAAAWAQAGVYAAVAAPYFAIVLFVGVGGVICYKVYECQYNRTTNNYTINAYVEAGHGNLDAAVQNFIDSQKRITSEENQLTLAEKLVNGARIGFVFKETQKTADTKLTNHVKYLAKLDNKEERTKQKEYFYHFDPLHMKLNKKNEEIDWKLFEQEVNVRIQADSEFQGFKRDLAACFFRQNQYDTMLASIRKNGTYFNLDDTYGLLIHGIAQLRVGHTREGRKTLEKVTEYGFALKSTLTNGAQPEKNKIYVGIKNGEIEYQVINTRGNSEIGIINAAALGNKVIPDDETQLKALLQDILAVTSERGHTNDNTANIDSAKMELAINNFDQRIIAAELTQLISDLIYIAYKLPNDNDYNKLLNKLTENKYTAISSFISLIINFFQDEINKLKDQANPGPSRKTQLSINIIRDLVLIEKGLRAVAYSGILSLKKEHTEFLNNWSFIVDAHILPYLEFVRSSAQAVISRENFLRTLINFSPEVLMKAPIVNNYLLNPNPNGIGAGLRFFIGKFLEKLAHNNNDPVLIKHTILKHPINIIRGPIDYFFKYSRVLQWCADFIGYNNAVDVIYYLIKNEGYRCFNDLMRAVNAMHAFADTIKNQGENIIQYLNTCCNQGKISAYYSLGSIYERGDMVEKNIVMAIKCYQYCLDNMYMIDNPLERIMLRIQVSRKLDLLLSDEISAKDLFTLAALYHDGKEIHRNAKLAKCLFEKHENKKYAEQCIALENISPQETSFARRKLLIVGLIHTGLFVASIPTMVGPSLAILSTVSWLIYQNQNKENQSTISELILPSLSTKQKKSVSFVEVSQSGENSAALDNTSNDGYETDENEEDKLEKTSRNYLHITRNTFNIKCSVRVDDVDYCDSDDEVPIWKTLSAPSPGKRVLSDGYVALREHVTFWTMLKENGYSVQIGESLQLPIRSLKN